MMLTNLASILRGAGLKVHEEPGWRTRGHGGMSGVRGVLWHHTAGAASGWYPSLNVVKNGRAGLPGPLSQLGLARDGTWIVIAAGRAWHAGSGYHPAIGSAGNNYLIGIEAENTGTGQAWPPAQIDSYRRGTAALLKAYGLGSDRVIGHKEWAPSRKIDPFGLDMNAERKHVSNYMRGGGPARKPGGIEEMAFNDTFKDWAGNKQSVHSWMNHVDKRVFDLTKDMDFLTSLVRRYTSDQSLAVQLPAHSEMLTEMVMLPPKFGVVTGNQGTTYVSLSAGENAEIEEVYFVEDWNKDGKPGKKTKVQGKYTLVAGDRQTFKVPGSAHMFCVKYKAKSTLAVGVEIDSKWK